MQTNDYYNLIVSSEAGHWDQGEGSTPKSRFLYCSVEPVTGRFTPLNDAVEMSLKQFPAIFACETGAEPTTAAYVGHITKVEHRSQAYYLHFERDHSIDPIPQAKLLEMAEALDIAKPHRGLGDLDSTHWSVKQADLYRVLWRNHLVRERDPSNGSIDVAAVLASVEPVQFRPSFADQVATSRPSHSFDTPVSNPASGFAASTRVPAQSAQQSRRVFIVHGHNVAVREEVARFVATIGLDPVILHEQTNEGRTILAKFQDEAAKAAYAIVLLTGDDRGGIAAADPAALQPRARQNVVFEFGFFAGSLGLKKVCALVDGPVENPSDIDGLLYVSLAGDWKLQVAREMRAAGLPVDPARLLG